MQTLLSVCDPPLAESYRALLHDLKSTMKYTHEANHEVVVECELPQIDLSNLKSANRGERQKCVVAIAKASSEWGFFQVLNHGISHELLDDMRREQMALFRLPFQKKVSSRLLNDSYRWGTPTAPSVKQFSWSEAFHVPLAKISDDCSYGEFSSLRDVMEKLTVAMSEVSRTLAGVLAENLGYTGHGFPENCDERTCFLRLNRYPPCPFSSETFGLMPHTDSDFLTILYQDQVGGLQLMKDSKWVAVKPNPDALIVNIGDLFQAWSNDIYKSVEHKVMANGKVERYSIAYFLCPSYDSIIGSCKMPSKYKAFTFGEFRKQVQDDVKRTGQKVGLPRFLL
ncbi:gibberellin 2-beta-dioxygenase 6-like [Typha angustifolia]|uniref:gibberellin 2-beta-dioxygenase 6-like n=1 Tax=Typha angustifolia TaxID=59011 RepID=UPI003C2B2BA2